jgi:hypothetical protein
VVDTPLVSGLMANIRIKTIGGETFYRALTDGQLENELREVRDDSSQWIMVDQDTVHLENMRRHDCRDR